MKNIIISICCLIAIAGCRAEIDNQFTSIRSSANPLEKFLPKQQIEGFLDFCNFTQIATGFITGCEKDPKVPNSNCYTYYPTLTSQISMIINEVNSTLIIPTNFIKLIDDVATLINRYSLFQNYCQVATLITRLDNTVTTIEGITGLLYKVVLHYNNVI